MADDIILTEEARKEACIAAVVAAVEAFQAMTPEQQEEHMAAQTAREAALVDAAANGTYTSPLSGGVL